MPSSCPDDPGLVRALRQFDVPADALLGIGGEACVYALDAERIVRVHHAGTRAASVSNRSELLRELAQSAGLVPFAIPQVLDTVEVEARIVTVERRLPGRTLIDVLGEASGEARATLLRAYMQAAAELGELTAARPWYGELCQVAPIRTQTFREYLKRSAARSFAAGGALFAHIGAAALASALPEPETPAFVHLDAYPGNMLADGEKISAVIDFGVIAIVGDRRLDPLSAAMYLTPLITPTATDADRSVAAEWLRASGIDAMFSDARRWVAAFWSFAADDARLGQWCIEVLCE